jgi:hypothetical protein
LARSTITRVIAELRAGHNDIGERVRRPGGGRNSAVVHQPGLSAALEALIEDASRGDLVAAALGQPQPTPPVSAD